VSGDIIWSINRVDDGPFRAYKFLGEDIRSDNPGLANEKLRNISESIVRDCIAKSTIHNILSNRNEIRKTISS
jgi:regulator of protease activity HflC (stomatin/prohibitin superfamily)